MFTDPVANPYDPFTPVYDPTRFFGRTDVFGFIQQQLIVEHHPHAIGLIGQRGIGKTSLLLQLPTQLGARTLIAYIDLSRVAYDEAGGLLSAMADAARAAFDVVGISTYRLPATPEHVSATELESWFAETYLAVTLSALHNNRRLLFAFDETAALFDALDRHDVNADLPDFLSRLLAHDERLNMLFTLDAADEPRADAFAPLADPLLRRRVSYLDNGAAASLTRQPAAPYYQLQDEAVNAIVALTGGSPFLLHVVNRLLFELSELRGHRGLITLADVRSILPNAIAEADALLRPAWERATSGEQMALAVLAALTETSGGRPIQLDDVRGWLLRESEAPVEETSLAATLRRLEYREVIRTFASRRYTFASGLQQQWLLIHGTPPPTAAAPLIAAGVSPRRLAVPLIMMIVVGACLVLLIGRLALGAVNIAAAAQSPTVTLGLNLAATQHAIDATNTQLAIPTATPTFTPTATFTATATATRTHTATTTPTWTASPTHTFTPTHTPTRTATASATATITDSPTVTNTVSRTPSPVPPSTTFTTPPLVPTSTPTASITRTVRNTNTITATASLTATPLPSNTPTASITLTATATATPIPSPSLTPTASDTATDTPTVTPTGTPSSAAEQLPTQRLRTARPAR